MIDIKRLESVLSGILSDRHNRQISVKLEGEDVNNNSDCTDSDSGRSARIPDVRNVV